APAVEPTPAEVLAPGVIEISDDEELSLEDILAEAEAGGTLVPEVRSEPPVSDLQMPPKRDVPEAPTAGLGDVLVLDEELGDDEDTLARQGPPVASTVVKAVGNAALAGGPLDDGPALDGGLLDEAAALVGAPMDPVLPLPGAPLDDGPALDGGLLDEAAALVGAPALEDAAALEDAPALDGSALMEDAPAMEAAPALDGSVLEAGPALDGGLLDDAPALVGAPFSNAPQSSDDALLPDSPAATSEKSPHEFGGAPFGGAPPPREDSDEISLADLAPGMDRAAAEAADLPTEPEPENPYATPPPSSSQAYIPVASTGQLESEVDALPPREADAPLPSGASTPGMAAAGPTVVSDDADEEEFPEPPALLDSVDDADAPPSGTPEHPLYAGDAEPFDPYAPNPTPGPGAAPSRLGSAPRALGELPPVVEGLYTPASNPHIDEGSGAYQTASFQPFPSAEAGLYGGREDVTFEQQQGNPRQRLAVLQQDDKSTHKLAQQHDLFLGEIEAVTSGGPSAATSTEEPPAADAQIERRAQPTDEEELDFAGLDEVDEVEADHSEVEDLAVVRAEAEELQAAVPDQELGANEPTSMHGLPELIDMEPTRPIDVEGAQEFTPAPHDLTPPPQDVGAQDHTPPPQELKLDDVEVLDEGRVSSTSNDGFAATYPEFNVIPDYDQPLDADRAPSGPAPAQSGHTIVASFEDLGLRAPSPADSVDAAEPSAPGDFAVLPSFGGSQIGAGFTMVASFDAEAEADVGASSTMIASAGDIEAWRSAGVASAEPPGAADAVLPPEFEEEQTGMYTPVPGSLPPLGPRPSAAPLLGSPALNDDVLTAMRVGRGAEPTGAGFALNPRGPAPELEAPSPGAAAKVSTPGPSSRARTNLGRGGQPAPPPKPAAS
ncbi:MAG: hypothetical protein KUG77_08405, partial [Nannocystaceae bacterium]|nr:hypothetical protein [Nannocystaceae bacterium]